MTVPHFDPEHEADFDHVLKSGGEGHLTLGDAAHRPSAYCREEIPSKPPSGWLFLLPISRLISRTEPPARRP